MSTVTEIEAAIERLPIPERESLEVWVLSRRFGLNAVGAPEHAELLASLDDAERDIDAGRGFSGDELRQSVRAWAGK